MEEQITNHLQKYNPEAIILIGSRASGEETETSDWDLALFVREDYSNTLETFEGETLDLEFIKLPVPDDFVLQTSFAPDPRLKVLLDTENALGQSIVDRTLERYKRGPEALTKEEVEKREQKLYRLLQKCQSRPDDAGYVFVYIGAFYEFALRYYFELKQEWPKPVYKALEAISEEDLGIYELFFTIHSNTESREKIKAAEELYEYLFNSEESVG
jgi:predicted nucleotidyltransferase